MTNSKLSRRLQYVASYVLPNSTVADIGSDHAYLPIYLVQNGIAKKAIAGEVADGPYQTALSSVKSANLNDWIDVRKGDGLSIINEQDHIDCVTIAGMGGTLITYILEAGKSKLEHVKRLILQPNIAAKPVREWLINNGWQLIDEEIVEEDGHIYEILVAEKGNVFEPYTDLEKELLFGPFLLRKKTKEFIAKWKREKIEWEKIVHQLNKAKENEQIIKKKAEFMRYLQWYEEEFTDETAERS